MSPVLSAKGLSPKGMKGKENTLPVKQQVGFQPGLQLNALTTWPQCHSKMGSSACVGQKVQTKKGFVILHLSPELQLLTLQ